MAYLFLVRPHRDDMPRNTLPFTLLLVLLQPRISWAEDPFVGTFLSEGNARCGTVHAGEVRVADAGLVASLLNRRG
jgi:hypothetical protein